MNIELYEAGTAVLINNGKLEATVEAVIIRGQNVSYEVGYFNTSGEYQTSWLPDRLVQPHQDKKAIMFHAATKDG